MEVLVGGEPVARVSAPYVIELVGRGCRLRGGDVAECSVFRVSLRQVEDVPCDELYPVAGYEEALGLVKRVVSAALQVAGGPREAGMLAYCLLDQNAEWLLCTREACYTSGYCTPEANTLAPRNARILAIPSTWRGWASLVADALNTLAGGHWNYTHFYLEACTRREYSRCPRLVAALKKSGVRVVYHCYPDTSLDVQNSQTLRVSGGEDA